MSRKWLPTNPKDIYSVTLSLCDVVPVLNAWVRKSFDSPDSNQTHNALMFLSKCKTFAL